MGYWGYGGYGGYGGYPAYSYPWTGAVAPPSQPAGNASGHGAEGEEGGHKKSGGVGGFFKGIANGAVNLVKGIFSVQGMFMLAGTVALTWATGGAILPLLGAIGLGTGGYQMLKGAADGNSEKIGEGFFNFGFSALGFAGPKTIRVGNTEYGLVGTGTKGKVSVLDRLKAPFGFSKYQANNSDEALNMYQLSWRKMQDRFANIKTNDGKGINSARSTRANSKSSHAATPLRSQEAILADLQRVQNRAHNLHNSLAPVRVRLNAGTLTEEQRLILANGEEALDSLMARHSALVEESFQAKDGASQANKGFKAKWKGIFSRKSADKEAGTMKADYRDVDPNWQPHMKPNQYLNELDDAGLDLYDMEFNTADDGISIISDDVSSVLGGKIRTDQTMMKNLETLFNRENLGQTLAHHEETLAALKEQFPKHAERLDDLWNLQVIDLIKKGTVKSVQENGKNVDKLLDEVTGPLYIKYFKSNKNTGSLEEAYNATKGNWDKFKKDIAKQELDALIRLNNGGDSQWSLSAVQKQQLRDSINNSWSNSWSPWTQDGYASRTLGIDMDKLNAPPLSRKSASVGRQFDTQKTIRANRAKINEMKTDKKFWKGLEQEDKDILNSMLKDDAEHTTYADEFTAIRDSYDEYLDLKDVGFWKRLKGKVLGNKDE